ncbi:MAG TPA: hypothetical protein VF529_00125 [Solirubrobacteraceae bacterium]|jgi:RNA polymerase sigma factor (sigma-70 family)
MGLYLAGVTARNTPATTADVAAVHDRLARFLYANFHRKLTFEETRDAAADALAEADRATAAGQRIQDLDAWLCTAAWRNAISVVRRIEGEGRVKRTRPVDISEQGEWLLDERLPQQEVVTREHRRGEREALLRVWSRLKPDEQRALHLRYFDELPVDDVLGVLGCSRHHYENLTKRGIRKLREALVEGVDDVACRACRASVVDAKLAPLPAAQAAARDMHLSSCLPCRAFQRRQRGLIALLPVPAAGLLDRLAARWQSVGSSGADPAQTGEAAAGTAALAAAGTSAGAGAVGASGAAGGILTVGSAAKGAAILCSAGALTAGMCAVVPPGKPQREPRAHATSAREEPPKRPTARPVVPVTSGVSSGAPRATPTRAAPETQSPASARSRAAAGARREAARRAASPFLPESAAPTTRSASAATPRHAETVAFNSAGTPAPVATTAPRSTARSSRTAFSEEFTP